MKTEDVDEIMIKIKEMFIWTAPEDRINKIKYILEDFE